MKRSSLVTLSIALLLGLSSCSKQESSTRVADWNSVYSIELSELNFWGNDTKYPKNELIRTSILNFWNDSVLYFEVIRDSIEANREVIQESEIPALDAALKTIDEYINLELKPQASKANEYLDCPTSFDKTKADLIKQCDQSLATVMDIWEKTGICVAMKASFELDSLESFDFDKVSYISTLPGKYGGFCGVFPGATKLEGYPKTIPAVRIDESFASLFETPWVVEVAPRLWASKPDGVGTIGAVLNSSWYGDCAAWNQWRDIFERENLGFVSGKCK